MKITEEEHRVYMSYSCGGGFISQERCYEILNEGRTTSVCFTMCVELYLVMLLLESH